MEIKYALNTKKMNRCFGVATEKDLVKVQLVGYDNFLEILRKDFQPDAVRQTQAIAEYIGESSNQDFFTLWYFMNRYIAYSEDEKGSFETIKLPNYLWENRFKIGGDCEDKTLMVSGILSNWNIEHVMVIEHLSLTAAHIYVQTASGIIIDPCNTKFNQQVRFEENLPLAVYRKSISLPIKPENLEIMFTKKGIIIGSVFTLIAGLAFWRYKRSSYIPPVQNYDTYLNKFVAVQFFKEIELADSKTKKTKVIKQGERLGGYLSPSNLLGGGLTYIIQENYGQASEAMYLIQAKDVQSLSYATK